MPGKPNFFIVGAPKSGTTSMYQYLKAHPDIFMPEKAKEPHYFAPEFQWPLWVKFNSLDAYLSLFEGVRDEHRIGEASVFYLCSEGAARRIHEFNPDARIIVMLRHPVEVMHSLYYQERVSGNETLKTFEQALEAEASRKQGIGIPPRVRVNKLLYRDIGRYSQQIQRYFECFGRENVQVIIFDDFVKDTAGVYRKTLEFLEADPDFQTEFVIHNPHKEIGSQAINRLLKRPPSWLAQAGDTFNCLAPGPARKAARYARRRIMRWNTHETKRPPINPETRRQLQTEFRSEIERLGQVLDRDLSFWFES